MEPVGSRLYWPDFPDASNVLLPWSWALERLARSRNYYLSTTWPDGRPHVAPVWAVWLEGELLLSTGARTRKARNLDHDPRCVLSTDNVEEAVVVEGVAR